MCCCSASATYSQVTESLQKVTENLKNHNTTYREKTGGHWISLIFYQISCAGYQV
jgi:hypothetical protein